MDLLLSGLSNKPGATELLLASGDVPTGYKLMDGLDLGNEDFDRAYSGARGTQGAVLASTESVNRQVFFPLMIEGTSQDDLSAKISSLKTLADGFRRFGGRVKWRPKGAAQYQYFIVLDGQANVEETGTLMHRNQRVRASLSLVCQPYLHGECMDILDDFSTDRLGEYTFDAGTAADVTILSGELDAVATTHVRAIHTAYGHNYGDHQATIRTAPGATIAGYKAGVVLKRLDALNYLEVYAEDNGANSYINVDKVVAGARTNIAQTIFGARMIDGIYFWLRGRIEGNVVYGEYFLAATEPSPMATPSSTATYQLSTAEAAIFGGFTGTGTITGKAGWSWTPAHTNAKLADWSVEPYTYRSITSPDELNLRGSIPGDAPALCEALVTPSGGAGGAAFGMLAWYERPLTHSRVWNGSFEENTSITLTQGWSVAAVTNISGAASSITNSAETGLFGFRAATVVCPATADTGASFRIFQKFRRGVVYTADVWVRSAAAVTNVYVRLGNGAANDKATSSNTALSTTKQKLTVAWTPSADRDDAHVAVNIAAATGTTFFIDAVMVYEGTVAPITQFEGRGALPAYGILEAENYYTGGAETVATDANFRSGAGVKTASAASGTLTLSHLIDPSVLVAGDQSDEVEIEVWARVELTSTMTAATCTLYTVGLTTAAPLNYSMEFGSAGYSMVLPSAGTVRRLTRAGTVRLRREDGVTGVTVQFNYTAGGATTLGLDYLLLIPANRRCLTPTGKTTVNYPFFVLDVTEFTRRIRPDLSGTIKDWGRKLPEVTHGGMGGALLELPAGSTNMLVKLSNIVPDNPTVGTGTEQLAQSATVHLSLTPRYSFARSS